jgi:hypothetical protein
MKSEDKLREFTEALVQEGCDREKVGDLEARLIEDINRLRRQRDRSISDMQAASLLPMGVVIVMERQGCSRSTAYRRAKRVSLKNSRATPTG